MKQAEDQQILEWISSTDQKERGFRQLVDKYKEKLYWHVRRMVLNHDDADDVLQNTFIKVYKSIDGFEGKSSLYTWLYKIATNETLTYLDKNKRYSYDSMEDSEEHPALRNLATDPLYEGDEIQLHLETAIANLPDKQKMVFKMRYHDELSYREIAEVLDTSEGALKASYHHAIKKIEQYFKSKELI